MDDLTREFPYELETNLKYIETIAHGAFGTVIHVIEISTKKDMAIKVINKGGAHISLINKMKEEISILRKLNHENIVKFFGFFETNNQLLIKMEYIKYGTLSHWMENHNKISEEEASIILKHVFSAVVYLHSKQICHRDIKPENIMLSKESDLHSIKIIDFGLSIQNFDKLINNDYCGTYIYMAPEQIEKKLYFFSVDIWSIGILMFMLLNNGKHPFYIKGDNREDFEKKIKECKITFYNKISPMAKHLILKLLEPNPSWRYTGVQSMKHPWITRNKEDEIPLTFNELLTKSNNKKILRDLFNICLFMNYLCKKKNKFIINKEYVDNCNFYNEKIKKLIIKKRERCLDVLSTDEGDEDNSDDKLTLENLDNKKEFNERSSVLNLNKIETSLYLSPIKQKKLNENKNLKNAKSSKNMNYLNKRFSTDKKRHFNFNKINFRNISSLNPKLNIINKNNNFSKNNNEINIKNDNQNNSVLHLNTKTNSNREFSNLNLKENKNIKIDNYNYLDKNLRKRLPYIASPRRRKEYKFDEFSLNNIIGNYNIVPIILPNITNIKRVKNLRYESIKKSMRKKSSIGKKNY